MPEIQAPRIAEELRRRFGIRGGAQISTLAPELVGVVVVENTIPRRESFLGMAAGIESAAAGFVSEVGIRNLSRSDNLIVDRADVTSGGTPGRFTLRSGIPVGTITGPDTHHRDYRNPLNAAAIVDTASDSAGPGGNVLGEWRYTASVVNHLDLQFTLGPVGSLVGGVAGSRGDAIHFTPLAQNEEIIVTWFFHFEPQENDPF